MAKILIVDDNPTYVDGLKAILQEQGYFVDYALGVMAALEKIKSKEFDLIFVDMKMYDFTGGLSDRAGLNLVPLIKSKSPRSKIVILTAGSKDTDAVETIEQGAVKYLRKGNFSVDYLLKLISQLLESREEEPQIDTKIDSTLVSLPDKKFVRWIVERSYGILDEVFAGLLVTLLIYFVGRVSGLLSNSPSSWLSSKETLMYIIIAIIVGILLVLGYFLLQKKIRKQRK